VSRIAVNRLRPQHFGVQVREGDLTTSHEVVVNLALLDDIGVVDVDQAMEALAVRETIGFLLDREPAASLEHTFSMEDVARDFPDYPAELRVRLGT
jgi:hypothetical protein